MENYNEIKKRNYEDLRRKTLNELHISSDRFYRVLYEIDKDEAKRYTSLFAKFMMDWARK